MATALPAPGQIVRVRQRLYSWKRSLPRRGREGR